MAYDQLVGFRSIGLPSSGDLHASQFCFVTLNGSAQVAVTAVSGALSDGVLQDKPLLAGDEAQVALCGCITKVVAGAAFNAGVQIMSNASGQAILATTGHTVMGKSLEAAASSGAIVPVLLVPPYAI